MDSVAEGQLCTRLEEEVTDDKTFFKIHTSKRLPV